ncbi:MAG TPA: DUF6691 family protein [Polyangiaceae bacterium]
MTARAWDGVAAVGSGILFGVGLVLSGMTRPEKVVGFLDVGGAWDPSLAFVMAGAIAVHVLAYRWTRARKAPLFTAKFGIPSRRDIDVKLLLGAGVFGVGWGMGGYCPGPGIVSLASGAAGPLVFVAAMLLGMLVTAKLEQLSAASSDRNGQQRAKVV